MYPEQTDPPPIKTKQELEASRRAYLAKIQEAKKKHAREDQQRAAAARQLQAEEELNRQRQATMRSLIDAANIAAGVYSVLPKAPVPAKNLRHRQRHIPLHQIASHPAPCHSKAPRRQVPADQLVISLAVKSGRWSNRCNPWGRVRQGGYVSEQRSPIALHKQSSRRVYHP
jgi:hypothetical protein